MIKFLDVAIPITFIITLVTMGATVQNAYVYFMGFCAGCYTLYRFKK